MATNGTWLCPTPLHRARLLDLEAKLSLPRTIMYGSLAVVFVISIPWIGWLPFFNNQVRLCALSIFAPRKAATWSSKFKKNGPMFCS